MLMTPDFAPPGEVVSRLRRRGYALVSPQGVCELAGCELAQLDALRPGWDGLPPDTHLKDGGHYRRRRHSCFVVDAGAVVQAPHRAHWQPVEYNALHGGMERCFEPMEEADTGAQVWSRLIAALGGLASQLKGLRTWYVEAHQFRIDTTDGIGRPTPEGAHRDGVDLVAVFLVAREGVKGGETRVFEAEGPAGLRFTLTEPWSLLLLDDERVIHESTPIQPIAPNAHRDTLVVTLRAGGFQGQVR